MREADHDDFAAVTVSTYEEAGTCRDALRSSISLHLQDGDKVVGPTQMAALKERDGKASNTPSTCFQQKSFAAIDVSVMCTSPRAQNLRVSLLPQVK